MLYVSNEDKAIYKEMLNSVPLEEARSFSAALLLTLRRALSPNPQGFLSGASRIRNLLDSLSNMQLDTTQAERMAILREGMVDLLPQILFAAILSEPETTLGRNLTPAERKVVEKVWLQGGHSKTSLVDEELQISEDSLQGSLAFQVARGALTFDEYLSAWLDEDLSSSVELRKRYPKVNEEFVSKQE